MHIYIYIIYIYIYIIYIIYISMHIYIYIYIIYIIYYTKVHSTQTLITKRNGSFKSMKSANLL